MGDSLYFSSPNIINILGYFLLGIGLTALIFLILREFFCWYIKVNRIVGLLEDIKENTTKKSNDMNSTGTPKGEAKAVLKDGD
jgi:hypothetical protein